MKQEYQKFPFTKRRRAFIGVLNAIVEEYAQAGFVLTLRQLYYQLVARGIVPNTEASYKNVGEDVNKGKLAGLIDWDAIEDRTRAFRERQHWSSSAEIMDVTARDYHMDLWATQNLRVYVIIEKEALAGVFEPPCYDLDVPMLSARGYPSGSVLRAFAQTHMVYSRRPSVFLHFGDHDPSGIDMSRDLETRLRLFSENAPMEFKRVALNMDQILDAKPPPNPTKLTDSRAAPYIKLYGNSSYELDALDPHYLQKMVREEIAKYIDYALWEERQAAIEKERHKLRLVRHIYFR